MPSKSKRSQKVSKEFEEERQELERLNELNNGGKAIERTKKYRRHTNLIKKIEDLINLFPKEAWYDYNDESVKESYYTMFSEFDYGTRDFYGHHIDQAKKNLFRLIELLKFELYEISNDI